MKKPLRQRIADAITILKGDPLPIDLAPMPKITTMKCEVRTISARALYGEQYHNPYASREVIRKAAEAELARVLGEDLLREGVIQFQEDDYEPALLASVRVLVPAEEDLPWPTF